MRQGKVAELMSACWSCKALGECFTGCECRKCVDPVGWEQAIRNEPHKFGNSWKSVKQMDTAKHRQLEVCGQGRLNLRTASEAELLKEVKHGEDKEAGLKQALQDVHAKIGKVLEPDHGKTAEMRVMIREAAASMRILARVIHESLEEIPEEAGCCI